MLQLFGDFKHGFFFFYYFNIYTVKNRVDIVRNEAMVQTQLQITRII